jgi:putative phosphoesterase
VIVVLSDTHRETGTGLEARAARAVAEADRVVHAGDFTTDLVLSAYREVATRLDAVHGNSDSPGVTDRLPPDRILQLGDCRVALTHHRQGGSTGLALWGRAQAADLVLHGHTHRWAIEDTGSTVLCNPGSHTAPRGGHATHVEFDVTGAGLSGSVVRTDGTEVTEFGVTGGSN